MPTHRHPFGPGQTQRRALRDSTHRIEIDPMDEAPTYHRDRRPIAEILTPPAPVPVVRDASVTMQLRRAPPATSLVMLWMAIGIAIGMVAMLAMLRT